MIGHREQRVGIGRKINANDFCLFVHDVIDKPGVMMAEAIMVLTPDVRTQKIIQRGDGPAPGNVSRHFQPFRVLVKHGIDDMDKGFVTVEKSMTACKQVTLEPTLAHVFAEDLHHPAVGGNFLVRFQSLAHPTT